MAGESDKFFGWLLLGVLASVGLAEATKRASVGEQMKRAIRSQAKLPEVRRKVAEFTGGCNMNEICRIERIYRFVADRIDYMPDPWNEEHFAGALETMYVGAGDCDCKCILLATLLRADGFRVALDFTPGHVFAEVYVTAPYIAQIPSRAYTRLDESGDGVWVPLESTAARAEIGWLSAELYREYLAAGQEGRVVI